MDVSQLERPWLADEFVWRDASDALEAAVSIWPSTVWACEWPSHPAPGHEGGRKPHIALDPATGQILADELARSDVHDTVPVPALLGRITGRIGRVYGDAAYTGGPTYRAVAEHRQALPKAAGVLGPKAPDVGAAHQLDFLSGRGRHARHVARRPTRLGARPATVAAMRQTGPS